MTNNFTHKRGTVFKDDAGYLIALKKLTEDELHPRHQGVLMQAHHALSEKGISLTPHGDRLADLGYDINLPTNLVFIPSTLQGACHLQVQPHRGNHVAVDSHDDDTRKDPAYHVMVMRSINTVMRRVERICSRKGVNIPIATQKILDQVSSSIISDIQFHPKKAKLTKVWAHDSPDTKAGCRGVDSIRVKKKIILGECPVDRNHKLDQGPEQNIENIKFELVERYVLKPGR